MIDFNRADTDRELKELQIELNGLQVAYKKSTGEERVALSQCIEVLSWYRRMLWDRLWELKSGEAVE